MTAFGRPALRQFKTVQIRCTLQTSKLAPVGAPYHAVQPNGDVILMLHDEVGPVMDDRLLPDGTNNPKSRLARALRLGLVVLIDGAPEVPDGHSGGE